MSKAATELLFHRSTVFNPYANLSLEQLFMEGLKPNEQLLFLWQNRHSVVIGRNQNPWKECRVGELEQSGGFLARRLSGGGAVYHDIGNLNFSFISPKDSYCLERNQHIICEAVGSFGIDARVSGRNDVEANGMKFSGNAFFETKESICHHGTLMVAVDTEKLSLYLQPDPRKLKAHSIDSVRSRVVNLCELEAHIDIESLSRALVTSFSKAYGFQASPLPEKSLPQALALSEKTGFFASPEWRFGKAFSPSFEYAQHYPWGTLDVLLRVESGIITDALVFSDALDTGIAERLCSRLLEQPFSEDAFPSLLSRILDEKGSR